MVTAILLILVMIVMLGFSAVSCGTKEEPVTKVSEEPQELWSDDELGIDPVVDEQLQDYRNVLLCDVGNTDIDPEGDNTPDAIVIMNIKKKTEEVKFISVYRNMLSDQDNGLETIKSGYTNGGMIGQIRLTVFQQFFQNRLHWKKSSAKPTLTICI